MRIEWDRAKNEINHTKHGVDFETAQLVFGEERWHAIGSIKNIVILVVVHTYREEVSDEVVRIVSARPATRRERKPYAQAIG